MALQCWKVTVERWVYCGHKRMGVVSNTIQVGCGVKTILGINKSTKKISLTTSHHHKYDLVQVWMDPCFYIVYTKFWPNRPNIQIKTHHTRQSFSNLALSQTMQIAASALS